MSYSIYLALNDLLLLTAPYVFATLIQQVQFHNVHVLLCISVASALRNRARVDWLCGNTEACSGQYPFRNELCHLNVNGTTPVVMPWSSRISGHGFQ